MSGQSESKSQSMLSDSSVSEWVESAHADVDSWCRGGQKQIPTSTMNQPCVSETYYLTEATILQRSTTLNTLTLDAQHLIEERLAELERLQREQMSERLRNYAAMNYPQQATQQPPWLTQQNQLGGLGNYPQSHSQRAKRK